MVNILDILGRIGFDWQVAVANTVNFLIVFFLLYKFLFPSIKKMIEARQKEIANGLAKAKEADIRLREVDEINKNATKKAKHEASEIIGVAKKKAVVLDEELQEKMEKKKKAADDLLRADFIKQREVMRQSIMNESIGLIKEVIVKTVELKPEAVDGALIEKAVLKVIKEA